MKIQIRLFSILLVLFFWASIAYGVKGDVNQDNSIDIGDVIISLQAIVGLPISGDIDLSADVNGDGDIGLEEAIYALGVAESSMLHTTGNEDFSITRAQESDAFGPLRTDTEISEERPSKVDYSSLMPEIKSQGTTGSCTAWATGYYLKSYQEAKEEEWDVNNNAFSPMFLYAMQCQRYAIPWTVERSFDILKTDGCALYSDVPFEVLGSDYRTNRNAERNKYAAYAEGFSSEILATARKYKSGDFNKLEGLGQTIDALASGPVVLAINEYSTDVFSNPWLPSPETNFLEHDPVNDHAGHAVLCVGYDDTKFGGGAVKFVNSWGTNWGINGFSWIRYDDFNDIVIYSGSLSDEANPVSDSIPARPSKPTNVEASDGKGPYVDISWNKVSGAIYYTIFRRTENDPATYLEIAATTPTEYRDYPEVGVRFIYSVVAYNELGSSDHNAADDELAGHVDIGFAKGSSLKKPVLEFNDAESTGTVSHFEVSNIDPSASAMEILISRSSVGPWTSYAWIDPGNFPIPWNKVSEDYGSNPFVVVVMRSSNGTSLPSEPARVLKAVSLTENVAAITSLSADSHADNTISLMWETDGGSVEYFEVWRYKASGDNAREWRLMGYADGDWSGVSDDTVLPGIDYFYSMTAVNGSSRSETVSLEYPVRIPIQSPNLHVYDVGYNYDTIHNPVDFDMLVWNTGSTTINDYAIIVSCVDWTEAGEVYFPFDPFLASDVAGNLQLPLKSGYQHTLSFSGLVPGGYADTHEYSWVFFVNALSDTGEVIDELYSDDNIIITDHFWRLYRQQAELELMDASSYPTGQITNPVAIGVDVGNSGPSDVYDYSICLSVYDHNDGNIYYPLGDIFASDIALTGQLPLLAGFRHGELLPFAINIPSPYGDGHDYSWIIDINCDGSVIENYLDDNIGVLNSTWRSYDLSKQYGELGLASINYYYGEVKNPVKMELEVWNTGETYINDYSVAIAVYDYNADEVYFPFPFFHASDLLGASKFPIPPGTGHVLLFSQSIMEAYADGHLYSWAILINGDEQIIETNENDNFMVSDLPWWSENLGRKGRADAVALRKDSTGHGDASDVLIKKIRAANPTTPIQVADRANQTTSRFRSRIQSPNVQVATTRSPFGSASRRRGRRIARSSEDLFKDRTNFGDSNAYSKLPVPDTSNQITVKIRPVEKDSSALSRREKARPEMKYINTRPFATQRIKNGTPVQGRKREIAGPIQFKKPEFNIDHRK